MNLTMATRTIQHTPIIARQPVLKAIGLGGGGSNAINRMIELGLSGVEFIAANTDAQALAGSLAPTKILLGPNKTRGLGAGGKPSIGEEAAEESFTALTRALAGADMVFLAAGLGGGTGTGSIPIAARAARAVGAVTVAIVTMPFGFEIGKRQQHAQEGLVKLRAYTDTLITIPNDRLLSLGDKNLTLETAFRVADDVLRQGIQGISELITQPGLINVDFAHIRQVMQSGGGALLSIGMGNGENKVKKSIERALHHPLLETINLENASGILVNITAGPDITFVEVMESLNELQEKCQQGADIIPGVITDPRMGDRCQAILIITGLGATPINDALLPRANAEKKPAAEAIPVQETITQVVEMQPAGVAAVDLDLPAFLRRRHNR